MSMKGSQLKKAPKTIKRLLELRKEVIVMMEKCILQVTRRCKPTGAETQPSLSITLQMMTAPMLEIFMTQTSES